MPVPLVEAAHISKTFEGVRALQDVCFDLLPGEVNGKRPADITSAKNAVLHEKLLFRETEARAPPDLHGRGEGCDGFQAHMWVP